MAVACAATFTPNAVLPIDQLKGCQPATNLRTMTEEQGVAQSQIEKGSENLSPSFAHPQSVGNTYMLLTANSN